MPRRRKKAESSEIPSQWVDLFYEKVDLQAAFECLDGVGGFYADGLRGHILALQLRFDEAWGHFRKSSRQAREQAKSHRDLQRRVAVAVLQVLAAISESPLDEEESDWVRRRAENKDGIERWLPPGLPMELTAEALGRAVMNLRVETEGLLLLHAGEAESALEIFETLREFQGDTVNAALASSFIGTGAAQFNLGQRDLALRAFENAGWTIHGGEMSKLSRIRGSFVLAAFYDFLERGQESLEWRKFGESICPNDPTRELFMEREQRIVERCANAESLLFI